MGNQSTLALFLPMIIITVPFCFLNASIAARKGKNVALFVILGLIPFVAMFSSVYPLSLTDRIIIDKIDKILSLLEANPK